MKKIIICLSILCLAIAFSTAVSAQNLLANPGFEDGTGTPPPPWITYGGGSPAGNNAIFGMSSTVVHSGSKSFSVTGDITTPIAGQNGPRQWAIPIDPTGKTRYELKAYINKTANLNVRIRWHLLNSFGSVIASDYSAYDNSTLNTWKEITTGKLQPVPGAEYICFTVYVEPNGFTNKGTVYIDDCSIIGTTDGVMFSKVAGTVKYGNEPIPHAIVGIKQSPMATADPYIFIMTDENGNYGPVYAHTGPLYIAAWKEGWAPSADINITGVSDVLTIVNPLLTESPGINLCLADNNRTPEAGASSPSSGNGLPAYAIDGDMSTAWSSNYNEPSADEYIYVNLANICNVSGVTLYWDQTAYPYTYTVDYTTDFPSFLADWIPIYTKNAATPLQLDPLAPCMEIIKFPAPVNARGIRIHATSYGWDRRYTLYELQVHDASANNHTGGVFGYVKDSDGNAISGALVHLGPVTDNNKLYKQAYTDANGFYSFDWYPWNETLTADALGYKNVDLSVALTSDGTVTRQDFTLLDKPGEVSLVPNWNFEQEDPNNPGKPLGWGYNETDPAGEVIFTQSTDHNHTAGGQACAQLDMRNSTDPTNDGKAAWIYSDPFPINADGKHAYNVWMWRAGSGWETYRNMHSVFWVAADGTIIDTDDYGFYGWGRWDDYWDWWRTDANYRLMPPAGAVAMVIGSLGTFISVGNGEPPIQAIDDVVVEEVDLASPISNRIADVKTLPNHERVSLVAKQWTFWSNNTFPNPFGYIEEFDRSAGIRLDFTGTISGDWWIAPSDAVNITGTMTTTPEGERAIEVETITWAASTRPLPCLGINSTAANLPNAQGLLVKMCGNVDSVAGDHFVLNDGGVPVKVYFGNNNPPTQDQKIRVRGVLSTDGTNPVLYMRDEAVDIVDASSPFQPLPFQGLVKTLRDYLFLGPFGDDSTSQAQQMATDYISIATGNAWTESTIEPGYPTSADGLTWIRHDGMSEVPALNWPFGGDEGPISLRRRTGYAYVYVWSPIDQTVGIATGSDNGIRMWVNGNLVLSNRDSVIRTVDYGQECTSVDLRAGWNRILFKLSAGTSDYMRFVCQIIDPQSYSDRPGWDVNVDSIEGLGYLLNPQP